jgi:TadE-like protein
VTSGLAPGHQGDRAIAGGGAPRGGPGRAAPGHCGAAGQATVEFALVAVLALVVFLAIVECAVVVFDQSTLQAAARAGARAGALAGQSAAQAVQAAESAATDGAGLLVSCPLSPPTADVGTTHSGQVTVALQCGYHPLTPVGALAAGLAGGSGGGAFTLSATAVQALEP